MRIKYNEKSHNKEISKIKRVETKSNSSFTVKFFDDRDNSSIDLLRNINI